MGSCKVSEKYFGKYQSETPYCLITLNTDYTFTSIMEVHGMTSNNSGTFEIQKDTIFLNYKNGIIDSAAGPPPKNLWKRKKLYYINELSGKVTKSPYAYRIK